MTINDLVNEAFNGQNDENYIKDLNEGEIVVQSTQYNHEPDDTLKVLKNPEEYIIPEELPACKMLWDRGIETYMCGNYDDEEHQGRWIGIKWSDLTEENKRIFDDLIKKDNRYSFGHWYKITVPFGKNAAKELCSLVDPLQYQDTKRYVSGADFLDSYKKQDGEFYFDDDGSLHHNYNPELANATLEEALINTGKKSLYDPILDRVYEDKVFMDWHNNYIEHQKQTIEEWNYDAHFENGVETIKKIK